MPSQDQDQARQILADYHVERALEDADRVIASGDFPPWPITSWDFLPGRHYVRQLIRTAGYTRKRDALKPDCACPLCRLIRRYQPRETST
jgi:hypothetical protein